MCVDQTPYAVLLNPGQDYILSNTFDTVYPVSSR